MKKPPSIKLLAGDPVKFFTSIPSAATLRGVHILHSITDAILTIEEHTGVNVMPFIFTECVKKLTETDPSHPERPQEEPEPAGPADPAAPKKGTLTPAGRRALSRKLKARWAEKRRKKAEAEKAAKK